MRFAAIILALASFASADHINLRGIFGPSALLQLGLEEKPAKTEEIKEKARKRFMALMKEAEEKATHDPAVLQADKALNDAHAKYVADTDKTAHHLSDIKAKLSESKHEVTDQERELVVRSAAVKKFTEEQNKKIEQEERELMKLQQKRISSFAELPDIKSSFTQLKNDHDGVKATEEIHAAQKALHDLGDSIKNRIESLTHILLTPGKQFKGEEVL